MIKNIVLLAAVLLALAAAINCNELLDLEEDDQDNEDLYSAIDNVIEKLSSFAGGRLSSSGLTIEDLIAAKNEWDIWPEDKRNEAKQVPMIRIVIDFVLTPISLAPYKLELGDESTGRAFIKRLELCFKKFLPAYEGDRLGSTVALRISKTSHLYESLSMRKPVTKRMFLEAKRETEAWQARLNELTTHEDIYAHLNELESLFNFFNFITLKPLWVDVFPRMNKQPELTAEQLVSIYHQVLMRKYNIGIAEDGGLIRYVDK